MPAPQAAALQTLAKNTFRSSGLQLAHQWKQPQGDAGKQYTDAFTPQERSANPDPSKLFVPASNNKYHVDTVAQISAKFEAYLDGICAAIAAAWSQFQSSATLGGVVVNAVTASGGVLVGPPLTPLILAKGPKATPQELKYTKTIAQVIGQQWTLWQTSVKVTGLPWYPPFAALPSPVAPPTPNTPVPLAAIGSAGASQMAAPQLRQLLIAQHADPAALHHKELFGAVAQAVGTTFQQWLGTTQVTNVLGAGPVPTFAPPFVPVGPVVGGVANMPPGGLV